MRDKVTAARLILRIALRADPARAVGVFVLTGAFAALMALNALWLKLIVNAAVSEGGSLMWPSIAFGATALLTGFAAWYGFNLRTVLLEKAGLAIDLEMLKVTGRLTGLEHFERPEYLDRIATLREHREQLTRSISALVQGLGLVIQGATTAILLASVHPVLLALPLFGLPSLWANGWSARRVQRATDDTAEPERRARGMFELATTAGAGKELRVFSLKPFVLGRFDDDWRALDRARNRAGLIGAAGAACGWLIFGIGYGGALLFVTWSATRGEATAGDVVLAVTLATQINLQIEAAAYTITFLARSLSIAERLVWLTRQAPPPATGGTRPVPHRLESGIDLRGVSFTYPGTSTEVLRGVDLHVPAGATVAIVGENGAGKSTLVKLLVRFYEPTSGRIELDGHDLTSFDVNNWRDRLSGAFQDFARFEFVAREVVGSGDLPVISDAERVYEALRRAAATDVVASLPSGLETQLGASFDEGTDLSGGQWQKLALGRGMMRPAPLLLILDEPTASLDAQTEHQLFERYAAAAKGASAAVRTITILVSHRFSTVRMADLIVVLADGRVESVGSHEQLMSEEGTYAELYDLQASAYR